MKTRIIILTNKWWEAVALVSVLEHARAVKPEFSACSLKIITISRQMPQECLPQTRLKFCFDENVIEVICIEDFIPKGANTSSSFQKHLVLQSLKSRGIFDDVLVIAFGTASSPEANCAGNVVAGSSVFVFNQKSNNDFPESIAFAGETGRIIESEIGGSLLNEAIPTDVLSAAQKRLLIAPNCPSLNPKLFVGSDYVSVGVINVQNNLDYQKIDSLALKRFLSVKIERQETRSVETTHGLIRLCLDSPFIYFSGITNQVGRFQEEVAPNKYSQNFAAAHNASICLSWILPKLCERLPKL